MQVEENSELFFSELVVGFSEDDNCAKAPPASPLTTALYFYLPEPDTLYQFLMTDPV